MSTEDVRIRVLLDIQEVVTRTHEMERQIERLGRTASQSASLGMSRVMGAATGAFAATFGQRPVADMGSLASQGTVGDISQRFSDWLGLGQAARNVSAVNTARNRTAAALGPAAATMGDDSIRSVFNAFKRQADMETEGMRRIEKATELSMSKASHPDGVLGDFLEALSGAATKVREMFNSPAPTRR